MNPFRYGKPVPPNAFVGRSEALRTIFSRLHRGESTAVVSEPQMGKSSLLRYIADSRTQSKYECDGARFLYHTLDALALGEHDAPADFWLDIADTLSGVSSDETIVKAATRLRENAVRAGSVIGFFESLASKGMQAVVAIDEFDSLVRHERFSRLDFFGLLRSASTRTDGLALVIASRLSVTELNRRTDALSPTGSPLFNNYIEVRLRPLEPSEVRQLLDSILTGTGINFSQEDCEFIMRLSGRHPFLVQLAGAALFDELNIDEGRESAYARADLKVRDQSRAYFDDLWRHLDARCQVALLAVTLAGAGKKKGGGTFDVLGDLRNPEWYAPELAHLAELGLVERGRDYRGEGQWAVAVAALTPWLIEDVIPGTRDVVDFNIWLREREFDGLLTRKERIRIRTLGEEPRMVFISYSSKDKEVVTRITADLRESGIPYWIDVERIMPGDSVSKALDQGLQSCPILMACLSANQLSSGWSRAEYSSGLASFLSADNKRVVPLILDDLPRDRIPPLLRDLHAVSLSDEAGYRQFLRTLRTQERDTS